MQLNIKNIDHSKGIENCKLHNLRTSKRVGKYTTDNIFIEEYCSIQEAASKNNTSRSRLQQVIKGKTIHRNYFYCIIK